MMSTQVTRSVLGFETLRLSVEVKWGGMGPPCLRCTNVTWSRAAVPRPRPGLGAVVKLRRHCRASAGVLGGPRGPVGSGGAWEPLPHSGTNVHSATRRGRGWTAASSPGRRAAPYVARGRHRHQVPACRTCSAARPCGCSGGAVVGALGCQESLWLRRQAAHMSPKLVCMLQILSNGPPLPTLFCPRWSPHLGRRS